MGFGFDLSDLPMMDDNRTVIFTAENPRGEAGKGGSAEVPIWVLAGNIPPSARFLPARRLRWWMWTVLVPCGASGLRTVCPGRSSFGSGGTVRSILP